MKRIIDFIGSQILVWELFIFPFAFGIFTGKHVSAQLKSEHLLKTDVFTPLILFISSVAFKKSRSQLARYLYDHC